MSCDDAARHPPLAGIVDAQRDEIGAARIVVGFPWLLALEPPQAAITPR